MAIKYQQKIHKAFADELNKERRKQYEEIKSQFPDAPITFKPSDESKILVQDNAEICRYFFTKSEDKEVFTFKEPRNKTVESTVRDNLKAYENAKTAKAFETFDDYKKIYSTLVKTFEDYFALAAESALREYFGNSYIEFADNFTEEESKRQQEAAKKRKAAQANK